MCQTAPPLPVPPPWPPPAMHIGTSVSMCRRLQVCTNAVGGWVGGQCGEWHVGWVPGGNYSGQAEPTVGGTYWAGTNGQTNASRWVNQEGGQPGARSVSGCMLRMKWQPTNASQVGAWAGQQTRMLSCESRKSTVVRCGGWWWALGAM